MPGPKYVSVVWISDFTVSTISAKHVHNKDMLFNFDIIGPVEYPNGKPKPFPMFPACVFQAANKKSELLVKEREEGAKKIEMLKKEKKTIPSDDESTDNSEDESSEDSEDEDSGKEESKTEDLDAEGKKEGDKDSEQKIEQKKQKSDVEGVEEEPEAAEPQKKKQKLIQDQEESEVEGVEEEPEAAEPQKRKQKLIQDQKELELESPSEEDDQSRHEGRKSDEPNFNPSFSSSPTPSQSSNKSKGSVKVAQEVGLTAEQITLFQSLGCGQINLKEIIEERDKYKAKSKKLKLENEELTKTNMRLQSELLDVLKKNQGCSSNFSNGIPSSSSGSSKTLAELAESSRLIQYVKLKDIETVCNRKVGAKGEEKWTFVVGDLMKKMWKHEELLIGCRQKTESQGKYKVLDIEMQKALITFTVEKFGVGNKEVGGRMTRLIRDTRTAQKIKPEKSRLIHCKA